MIHRLNYLIQNQMTLQILHRNPQGDQHLFDCFALNQKNLIVECCRSF